MRLVLVATLVALTALAARSIGGSLEQLQAERVANAERAIAEQCR